MTNNDKIQKKMTKYKKTMTKYKKAMTKQKKTLTKYNKTLTKYIYTIHNTRTCLFHIAYLYVNQLKRPALSA